MKMSFTLSILASLLATSCISTKNTIQNIDNNAPIPLLRNIDEFEVTEMSPNAKYGYDEDFPVNVFYLNTANDSINQHRYLNALAGPNGEKIFYKKTGSCCPFPSSKSDNGAGFLDIYELTWVGCKKPIQLYLNTYEKGNLYIPKGLSAKK